MDSSNPFAFRPDPSHAPPPAPAPRAAVLAVSGMVSALTLALLASLQLPYNWTGSGPTFDVFGEAAGGSVLTIEGAPTFEPSGELRLTTVRFQSGDDGGLMLGEVLKAWLSPNESVVPWVDRGSYASDPAQDWVTSQEKATVSALEFLGERVPATIFLAAIDPESNAYGLLVVGDEIVTIDGTPIVSWEDLDDTFATIEPGDPVTVTVNRDGVEITETFDTIDDGEGRALMGVYIDPEFDLPVSVNVDIDNVGGPSAGLIFTLAIIDLLTPDDELHGALVAGTGTIDLRGNVGAIGGIPLKMVGAAQDGAEWFLAPLSNCPNVVGHVPDGLRVVAVSTLEEAYRAIVTIGDGAGAGLPTCE